MEFDIVADKDTLEQIEELKKKMKKAKTNAERREAKVAARWPNGVVPYEFDPGFRKYLANLGFILMSIVVRS